MHLFPCGIVEICSYFITRGDSNGVIKRALLIIAECCVDEGRPESGTRRRRTRH